MHATVAMETCFADYDKDFFSSGYNLHNAYVINVARVVSIVLLDI